jgi:hypothetical protein
MYSGLWGRYIKVTNAEHGQVKLRPILAGTTEQPLPLNKDTFVMVPLIASAFALTFDVGYFWGTDISFLARSRSPST